MRACITSIKASRYDALPLRAVGGIIDPRPRKASCRLYIQSALLLFFSGGSSCFLDHGRLALDLR